MEIIVLGAGAIGSLYGAKLALENDVTLIARSEHAHAINAHGLRLTGLESQVVRIRALTELKSVGPNALLLVTTKVSDTATALAPITPFLREDTNIVALQNGLDAEKIVRRALDDRGVVLRGITQFGAIFDSPGTVQFMARGYTLLEKHQRSDRIANILNQAGLDCRISPDITRDVWHKLVINCVVNPITAILGCEVGGIANPQLDSLKELVIAECVKVAATQGVALAANFQEEISDFFRPSHNIASMLQDLRRGRVTEIDYLNGAVADLGLREGIDCPVNAALTGIVKAMETASLLPKKMLEPEPA